MWKTFLRHSRFSLAKRANLLDYYEFLCLLRLVCQVSAEKKKLLLSTKSWPSFSKDNNYSTILPGVVLFKCSTGAWESL